MQKNLLFLISFGAAVGKKHNNPYNSNKSKNISTWGWMKQNPPVVIHIKKRTFYETRGIEENS